ncbi:MAG TPA: mandelate racemase/muconate lactonizing enzyme family protein, partial [Chloroflexota bacterium]|nr:mandelate racemase/muconate lactonizing enzyme family protein [Chloroflexota bacterium]
PTGTDEGFEPGDAVRGSVEQFAALRKALGDSMELCTDVHTRLDPSDAIQLCRAIEPYRPYFVEDPIRSENPQSFRYLREHVHVPLAAGEQFASKWEFRQFLEEDLIDYARVDICICGGITESRKVANWAETHYIKLVPHNPLGPVSSAACLHLSLAVSNFGVMEQPQRPGGIMTNAVPVQLEWQDGYLLPPTRPGLGIEFDREAARRLKPEGNGGTHPMLQRIDGSFTNW